MYEKWDYDRSMDEQMKSDLGKNYDFRQYYDDTIKEVLDVFAMDYGNISDGWRAVYEAAVESEIDNTQVDNIGDFTYEMCTGKLNDLADTVYLAVYENRVDAYEQLISDYGSLCPRF